MSECAWIQLRGLVAPEYYPITISFTNTDTGVCVHMQVVHAENEDILIPPVQRPLTLRMDYADGSTYERAI